MCECGFACPWTRKCILYIYTKIEEQFFTLKAPWISLSLSCTLHGSFWSNVWKWWVKMKVLRKGKKNLYRNNERSDRIKYANRVNTNNEEFFFLSYKRKMYTDEKKRTKTKHKPETQHKTAHTYPDLAESERKRRKKKFTTRIISF